MEPTTNHTPTLSSPGDDDVVNGDGVCTDELIKPPPEPPHSSEEEEEEDDDFDFGQQQDTLVPIGLESNEATDIQNGSRSVGKNQSLESVDVVRSSKDSQAEPDSLDDDVEIVIKNQHKYYFYCPCCGEDITKTVKLVKKSDLQPIKTHDTENDTKNDTRSKDKKRKIPSWFPVNLQKLFLSVYGHFKDKDKKEVDSKSPGSSTDLDINVEEPIRIEKDRKWILDVSALLFLCIVIALSVLLTFPQQSPLIHSTSSLPFIPQHLQLPSTSTLQLPSTFVFLLLPVFAVFLLVIKALRYNKDKGDTRVDSKSTDVASEEQNQKTQYQEDKGAAPDNDSEKKIDNQKVHPTPLEEQLVSNETQENAETAKTEAEPVLQSDTQPEIPKSVEPKLEILKSIVYGGLTQSITSLCTVTSAAASGASTLNVLALGVANLSSGLLLIVHSLQELINEKPKRQTNSDGEEEEEDRYEETLGRRNKWKLHKFLAVSSFVIFGLIPPLVYGFSFRRRSEKRQEYKTLAVYAASLVCIALLSIAKAYVSKRREYFKTLFRYTTMATTASGCSQFVGYLVTQWLEKSGFYDDSPETPRA